MNRRELMISAVAAGMFFRTGAAAAFERVPRPAEASKWALWYRQPAEYWVEALPVGTGRLGAMAFGGTGTETLQLNEDTFWAGGPYDPSHDDARPALDEIRSLIWQEKWAEAQDLTNASFMARPLQQMPYQTLGNLKLESAAGEKVSNYRRWLDLATAAAITAWTSDGRSYRRSVVASAADEVILVRFSSDKGPVTLELTHDRGDAEFADGTLWLSGRNNESRGIEGKLRFVAGIEPRGERLKARFGEGKLVLEARGEITLVIAAATNYRNWQDVSGDPETLVRVRLDAARGRTTGDLLARQQAAHAALFEGFEINLGADPFPDVATDDRIRFSHDSGLRDNFLPALYAQYARYLLIASSRPGSQPANLQGIWNNSDTPPWDSKYTININTEMNYWPAEPMGLASCVEPLIAMVEDLAVSGRRTAERHYGARGWVTHHNTDLWRATAPIDGAFWGMWPMGGAWLCQHLWDHWDFSRDRAVLERIYPVIRDAGLFFIDAMVELPDGSGLVTAPSNSPENAHHDGVSICAGPACDRQILRNLFGNIIEASELLGTDEELRGEFSAALARIPADRIGEAGQLQEWLEDWDMGAPEIQHRHVSHLYGVYPGHQIGPETPALYDAANRSLEIRGDDATGWGIGWRINLWARLGNGYRAHSVLRKLLGPDRTYPNMFDAHPPFQIDGNFGGAAGILEMLVRDRPQELALLPALPARFWPAGHVHGVRLRGAMRLDLAWADGKLATATLTADRPATRTIRYGAQVQTVSLAAGEQQALAF